MRSTSPTGVAATAKTAVLRMTLASAAAALLAPAALAETVPTNLADGDDPTTVTGVTVEAQKPNPKLGDLVDAPQSVTVVPNTVIEARGATTLRDVLRNVPGISMQAGEGGVPAGDNLTLRGFSARTDMFVDGVRDVGGYTRDSFNLESVEVLKGPTSAYVGRGATGGSINQISKAPGRAFFIDGTVAVGTDAFARATVDANLPLQEGAALRIALMSHDADAPGRDYVNSRRWGFAPTLAFGLDGPTQVTIGWLHLSQDNVPDYGIPWVTATNVPLTQWRDKPAPVDPTNYYGMLTRDFEDVDTDVATLAVEHEFSDTLSLNNVLRYVRTHRNSIVSAPRFAGNASTDVLAEFKHRDQIDDILINQTTLEADFAAGGLRHDAVAGLEVSRETGKNHFLSGPNSSTTDLYAPNPWRPYTGTVTDNGMNRVRGDGASLYAFDTVTLNERWQVAGGLRWDSFKLTYDPATGASAKKTDEMLSWKAGLVYKPTPKSSVYFGYGTSFAPGVDAINLATANVANNYAVIPLDPEESRSYELGTKWELFDDALLVTAAVFRTEKTNARTPGLPGDPPTVLEGEQRVDGFEIGAAGDLTDTVSVFAGYSWMKGEILASNTAAEVGKTLANTPEHTFNAWLTWTPVEKLELGAGAQYVSTRFANNLNTREVPAYWTFDAMAAYDVTDHVVARLNVYNLADEVYFDNIGGGHLIPGAARSAVLSVGFRF